MCGSCCLLIAAADAAEASGLSYLRLLAVPALVALNGYFVAAEFALVALRKTRVEEMVKQGVSGSAAVEAASENLDRSIAATQLGITLASIALGWVGEPALASLIVPRLEFLPAGWKLVTAHTVAFVIAFSLITVMHVVFGELMPKAVALQSPERTALWIAKPLNVFARLSRPLIALMNGTGNSLLWLIGYRATGEEALHSAEEIRMIVEDSEEAGLIDPEQSDYVQNALLLAEKSVRDCMVGRDTVAALDVSLTSDQVLEAVRSGAHTRMPVYDGELDNIVGIVNTKNLFFLFSSAGVINLEDAMYPPLYMKPDDPITKAIQEFKKARRPMAIVRDDGNRVMGILTLEDVLEEIVGEIEDEHDRPLSPSVEQYRVGVKRYMKSRPTKRTVRRPHGGA